MRLSCSVCILALSFLLCAQWTFAGLCDDFYYQPCDSDSKCKYGYECKIDYQKCYLAQCKCNPKDGKPYQCSGYCKHGLCVKKKETPSPSPSKKPSPPPSKKPSPPPSKKPSPPPKKDLCKDFYWQGCEYDYQCKHGFVCKTKKNGCYPSTCTCDKKTGKPDICTQDCRKGYCVKGSPSPSPSPSPSKKPPPKNLCKDFYYKGCDRDNQCKHGFYCKTKKNGCFPGTCECNKNTGKAGKCSRDCRKGFCVKGSPPPVDCHKKKNCPQGYKCRKDTCTCVPKWHSIPQYYKCGRHKKGSKWVWYKCPRGYYCHPTAKICVVQRCLKYNWL